MSPTRAEYQRSPYSDNKSGKGEVCRKCWRKHGDKDACSSRKQCHSWTKTGHCRFGNNCKFEHGNQSKGPKQDTPEDRGSLTPSNALSSMLSDDDLEDLWGAMQPYTCLLDPTPDCFILSHLRALLNESSIDVQEVSDYLLQFPTTMVAQAIKDDAGIDPLGMDPLFFAVASNHLTVVKLLIKYGANVNATFMVGSIELPLLAFAILRGDGGDRDTTELVRTLLSHGADPSVIGGELFSTLEGPDKTAGDYPKVGNQAWCSAALWEKLRVDLNITQKYLLNKASKLPSPSIKLKQVARTLCYEPLMHVPYNLIGQDATVQELTNAVLTHGLLGGNKPLILIFAGPSGHGKTELATQMGSLLSLPFCAIDCTEMEYKKDLFGAKSPYQGWQEGSLLNNFLCSKAGKPCIVFLDEFEKCGKDVHEALLLPFDQGAYRDQRESASQPIDCTKVIWIIATNCADNEIQEYFARNEEKLTEPLNLSKKELHDLMAALEKRIRINVLKPRFGAPFTGRINRIFPFFPFSQSEQLIVGAKYINKIKEELAGKIAIRGTDPYLVRHMHLTFEDSNDHEVCRVLVEGEYDRTLGARSIANAVDRKLKQEIVKEWLLEDEEVTEDDNEKPAKICKLAVRPLEEGGNTIVVKLEDHSRDI